MEWFFSVIFLISFAFVYLSIKKDRKSDSFNKRKK